MKFELVQRTPFLLAYRATVIAAGDQGVLSAELVRDAERWRDRPIHKLVTTPIIADAQAARVLQGFGLIDTPNVDMGMRGRITIVPVSPHAWGVHAGAMRYITLPQQPIYAAVYVDGPLDVQHDAAAIIYIEVERAK